MSDLNNACTRRDFFSAMFKELAGAAGALAETVTGVDLAAVAAGPKKAAAPAKPRPHF